MKKIWWNTSAFIKDKCTILKQDITILPTKGSLDNIFAIHFLSSAFI